jgi:hypothetical protein
MSFSGSRKISPAILDEASLSVAMLIQIVPENRVSARQKRCCSTICDEERLPLPNDTKNPEICSLRLSAALSSQRLCPVSGSVQSAALSSQRLCSVTGSVQSPAQRRIPANCRARYWRDGSRCDEATKRARTSRLSTSFHAEKKAHSTVYVYYVWAKYLSSM